MKRKKEKIETLKKNDRYFFLLSLCGVFLGSINFGYSVNRTLLTESNESQ